MNKLKKIICLVLALSMIMVIFASCNKDDDKDVLATYDSKGKVRESDIKLWMNYLYVYNYENIVSGQMTEKDVATQAISSYLLNMFLDEELRKLGIGLDDKEIVILKSELAIEMDRDFNETDSSTGKQYVGYDGFLEAYGITDEFVTELVKFTNQEKLMAAYIKADQNPTDEELRKYYEDNAFNYAVKAAYIYNFALVEVKDMQDKAELEAAKKEAEEYIAKLKAGTMTFEQVALQVTSKYTVENGYSGVSENVSGVNIDIESVEKRITNLDEYISVLKEGYAPLMDSEADKSSDQYNQYLRYLLDVFTGTFYYVLYNEKLGIYEEPIEYPSGYVILEYVNHRNSSWGNFEELKEQIKNDYLDNIVLGDLTEYEAKLLEKHKVELKDFSVGSK